MSPTVVVDFSPLSTPTRVRGIGRYLQTLALGLSRLEPRAFQGLRVRALLSIGWSGQCHVTDDFTDVLRHAWPQDPNQADRYRWAYARRLGLWSAVRRLDAKLVHLGDPNATPLAMPLSKCKRVVTCHDLIPLQFPSTYLGVRDGFGLVGKQIILRRYRSADHVVAISDATRGEVMRLVGVPAERITRVHNGVDLAGWSPEDPGDDAVRLERHGLRRGRFLVYVGDTDWRKNPEGMMRGLAVARNQGADVDLAFVGRLEPHKVAAIQQQAAREGVHANVRLLGFVSDSDLRALYRTALAHLFVSRSEGFGYTVIEAMASGCPVITTNCGSLAEVAGDAAMLVDPEDPERIGQAIVELERGATLRSELAERGARWAKGFSCEKQASAMLDVFRRLAD
jgi:glycosyltransferase involved in cell wall biosynthesis